MRGAGEEPLDFYGSTLENKTNYPISSNSHSSATAK